MMVDVAEHRPAAVTRWWRERRPEIACALAVLAVLLAYVPTLRTPFFAVDDTQYVTQNEVLQQAPLARPWRFFTTRTNPFEYLPLRDLSYRVDFALFGLHATGYRLHNLVLYALTCAGVWWLVAGLLPAVRGRADPADRWMVAVATALFAAHPAHVESVAWVSGRKDLLSGLLAVMSLGVFTRAVSAPRVSLWRLAGCYLLFACAVLSKSTVVAVPVVAWLIGMAVHDRRLSPAQASLRAGGWVAPLLLIAGLSVALQVWGSATYASEPFDGVVRSLADRMLLPVRILGMLARIVVWPVQPRLIYDVEAPGLGLALVSLLGVVALGATIVGAWWAVLHRSPLGLGLAMAGVLSAPFLQVIPFYTWSYASERFLYLPVVGASLAAAAGLSRLRPGWRSVLAAVLVLLATAGTATRALQWRDAKALFVDTARQAPTSWPAAELGIRWILLPEHRFEEARAAAGRVRVAGPRRYLQTYVEAKEAVHLGNLARLRPLVVPLLEATQREDYASRLEVANMALEAGLFPEAERAYRSILSDFPAAQIVRYNLGLLLARQRRFGEGADAMQAAVDDGYVTAPILNNLGLARRNAGDPTAAVQAFRLALARDPRHWHAGYNLARLLWARGDRAAARAALHDARGRAAAAGASTRAIDEVAAVMQ